MRFEMRLGRNQSCQSSKVRKFDRRTSVLPSREAKKDTLPFDWIRSSKPRLQRQRVNDNQPYRGNTSQRTNMVMQNTRVQLGRGRSFPYSAVAFCCAICCLIALGSIVGANFAINNYYKSWIEATGTVVGDVERIETYYENNRYRESLLYCGIIEYTTVEGETVQGETQTCSSSRWTVGLSLIHIWRCRRRG